MVVFETIYNFIMKYVLGVGDLENSLDFDIWQGFFYFRQGGDFRLVWSPFDNEFMGGTYNFIELFGQILTIIACVSLCVMLWKLLTIPIRWAIQRSK